ncbi:hydroxylamine reductase [Clostridium butyricum]|uniref:hydroxylamine reductase n=1 Tax=Clostridium butyricum TaxID=1492 RepID=UPI0013F8607B|nr:hydroxylamine reductase [Clostridium butyricum]MCQ2018987.1 hydroxylamine reductase [Clostridium butyricum]MCQ2023626.1 hydroxylamine reductase [Clostridium butyricum]MDU4751045.1 hydroxylamine reductase [Clostridium butyricum]NFB72976.1 hydroxylamine reductase [Clostridium butyricum]NFB92577.1 hydroxylamine reductase [Clostridium butyricum]
MGNNMELEYPMFCYQCEQTAGGKGCTKLGVCGKTPEVSNLQDLLIFQLKGISCYAKEIIEKGEELDKNIVSFIENCLFTTLTNVNFDADNHIELLKESDKIKNELKKKVGKIKNDTLHATYKLNSTKSEMLKDAKFAGIMYDEKLDPDIRSLRQTIVYGLKGISAYGHQARELGYYDDEVDAFYIRALEAVCNDTLSVEDLLRWTMRTGEMSVAIMRKLDEANTKIYDNPSPQKVNTNIKKGPFIIVSGHDLKDLEMILEQTEGKGINIYTHGEMIPCHGYPGLKKYKHLVGNFGGAWQNQQKEFDNIPGCILMTTNCLMKPRESYKDRIFTTSVVGWDGVKHIAKNKDGKKDFSVIINKALELGGYKEDEEVHEILVGFGHHETLSHAETIINAVKEGKIRHFFLIGGCDGARPGRNYYTEFAKLVPRDCIILTLACGKYRFNKLNFGEVAGLPRLLDVGQCNDAYSAVRIATALSDAFNTDVNGLPISIILSWYEQKAVADLLALLSLGIKGIYLGPTLPAFLSPNVLQYLVDTFDIKLISTPEDDLKSCLKQNL